MATIDVRLTTERLDVADEYGRFNAAFGATGAVCTFDGHVRGATTDGAVEALHLDWYPGLTEKSLEAIGQGVAAAFDIAALTIVHRGGTIPAGEAIVFVAAASAHRRAAFEAADCAMDRLKSEAAFWKREVGQGAGGTFRRWVEPTARDAADLRRWSPEQ